MSALADELPHVTRCDLRTHDELVPTCSGRLLVAEPDPACHLDRHVQSDPSKRRQRYSRGELRRTYQTLERAAPANYSLLPHGSARTRSAVRGRRSHTSSALQRDLDEAVIRLRLLDEAPQVGVA